MDDLPGGHGRFLILRLMAVSLNLAVELARQSLSAMLRCPIRRRRRRPMEESPGSAEQNAR